MSSFRILIGDSVLKVVHDSKDYEIVLLPKDERWECPYGIRNRVYDVVEVECQALFVAYKLIEELQENLDEMRPALRVVH